MKYVLVTGGVVSGIGKGVTASSIGVLMQNCGHRVTSIKIDPYLNIDAGTMSPFEHGEVFVLDDGGEVDLDLGNYERFLDLTLARENNLTTGKVYQSVIDKERRGDYLGKTVQVVPHVTDAIQEWIQRVAHKPTDGQDSPPDVCVIELGGTIGDIESMAFIEALRQLQFKVGPSNFCVIHVSLVPVIGAVGEQKTKPTQHSVATLRSLGLHPNLLACRSGERIEEVTKQKLATFCQVPAKHVLNICDVSNIWWVPLILQDQLAHEAMCNVLGLGGADKLNLSSWRDKLALRWDNLEEVVKIAVIGKYTVLADAYQSVIKALFHAALHAQFKLELQWVEAQDLLAPGEAEDDPPGVPGTSSSRGTSKESAHSIAWQRLREADGVLVPGGFGYRGVEGMILAVQHARENKKPFLGVCLGMQVAVIEFARNVLGMTDAYSQEFDQGCRQPLVVFMPEGSKSHKGGTMRLGSRDTLLQTTDCMTARLYRADSVIKERHRHRYEVNPAMVSQLEAGGLRFVGKDETGKRMEVVELGAPHAAHPFYLGVQYHPEFKSRPYRPSPPYLGFLLASSGKLDAYLARGEVTGSGLGEEAAGK